MKKIKIIACLMGTTCLFPSLMTITSCKKDDKKPTEQEYTIKFSSTGGVEFIGDTAIKVKKGTKLSEVKFPEVKMSEFGIETYGWINDSTKLFVDPTTEIEITNDLSFTFLTRTSLNKTTFKMYDKDRETKIMEFDFIKGVPFKTLKSYYGDFKPQMDYRYHFNGWKDINEETITDETILNQEEIRVYADCTWVGATITFSHNRYSKLKDGQLEPEPINIEEDMTWGDLVDKNIVPQYEPTYDGEYVEAYSGWFDQSTGQKIDANTKISHFFDFRPIFVIPPQDVTITVTFEIYKQKCDGEEVKISSQDYGTIDGCTLEQFIKDIGWKRDKNPNFGDCGWFIVDDQGNETRLSLDYKFDVATSTTYTLRNRYSLHSFCLNSTKWSEVVDTTAGGYKALKTKYQVESFVGLERKIELFDHIYTVRVIGENHDDYADGKGKAPLTYELKEVVTDDNGNPLTSVGNWTDVGFYPGEYLLKVLNQESGKVIWFEEGSSVESKTYTESCISGLSHKDQTGFSLGSAIKPIKKSVYKKCSNPDSAKLTSYTGKLFLLSTFECGTNLDDEHGRGVRSYQAGTTYSYYKTHNKNSDRIKYTTYIPGTPGIRPSNYWLGQPAMYSKYEESNWYNLEDQALILWENGRLGTWECTIRGSVGVSFAFCL